MYYICSTLRRRISFFILFTDSIAATGTTKVLLGYYLGTAWVLPRFYHGSTKVLLRFYQGSTKVLLGFYHGSTKVLPKSNLKVWSKVSVIDFYNTVFFWLA